MLVFGLGMLTFACFFNQAPLKRAATLRREVPVDKSTYHIFSPGRPSGPNYFGSKTTFQQMVGLGMELEIVLV